MNARFINTVEKVWGREDWIVNEPEYCAKLLTINPGFQSSLHAHAIKKETFIVQKGFCRLLMKMEPHLDFDFELHEGASKTILPGIAHRFSNIGDRPCVILEVSTHHDDQDCARLEESGPITSSDSAT